MIQQFSNYQKLRGFSADTIRRRRGTLCKFQAFIQPASLTAASSGMVADFLALHPRPATRHAYRSDLQSFYLWAVKRDLCPANPVEMIDPIRVPKTLPRPVPPELVPGLIAQAPNEMLRYSITLAAYGGLRVGEIARLDSADVDMAFNLINIREGKGGKDRQVPLHPAARSILRPAIARGGRVVPFAKNTIGMRVSEYLHAMGLNSSCHKLRATFATSAAEASGGNVVMVQRLMGHENPATSMLYIGWAGGEAASVVAQMYRPAAS